MQNQQTRKHNRNITKTNKMEETTEKKIRKQNIKIKNKIKNETTQKKRKKLKK
jgi:hypothetical protein